MPTRTCCGCRERDDSLRLLRFVFRSSSLFVDVDGAAEGRGVYFHPRCVKSKGRKGFSLRQGKLDDELIRQALKEGDQRLQGARKHRLGKRELECQQLLLEALKEFESEAPKRQIRL